MNDDPLAPARGIMWAMALSLIFYAALFAGICAVRR